MIYSEPRKIPNVQLVRYFSASITIYFLSVDPFNSPACPLFEGDLCLDPEDRDVVNQVTEETDIKRNVIRNKKKLWPGNKVLYFVDPKLRKLKRKLTARSLLVLGSLHFFQ